MTAEWRLRGSEFRGRDLEGAYPALDVLHREEAEIRGPVGQLPAYLLLQRRRYDNATGIGKGQKTRGDVDAVTVDIIPFGYCVCNVGCNSDSERIGFVAARAGS